MLMLHWGGETTVNSLDISHSSTISWHTLLSSLQADFPAVPGGEKFHIFDWLIQAVGLHCLALVYRMDSHRFILSRSGRIFVITGWLRMSVKSLNNKTFTMRRWGEHRATWHRGPTKSSGLQFFEKWIIIFMLLVVVAVVSCLICSTWG